MRNENTLIALFTLLTITRLVAAQENMRGKIFVSVRDKQDKLLENATIELIRAKDSSLVKTAITDKTGSAEFENIRFGNYLVKVTITNYSSQYSSPFTLSVDQPLVQLPKLRIEPAATSLETVTITARKPFIQKLTDRIVVNVEKSIVNAGSSAMDVLERSPGINIDQNDAISLRVNKV